MSTARLVSAETALQDWDFYEPPIAQMLEQIKIGNLQKYTIQWVKASLRQGSLQMTDLYEGSERRGFSLMMIDRSGVIRSLILWFVHLEPGSPHLTTYWPELRRLGKRFGCPLVEFVSCRPGVSRAMRRWKVQEIYRGYGAEIKGEE